MIGESSERIKKQEGISARARNSQKIVEVLKMVTRKTIQEHARAGRKIPLWRDNQVVWIVPEIEDERNNETQPPIIGGDGTHSAS